MGGFLHATYTLAMCFFCIFAGCEKKSSAPTNTDTATESNPLPNRDSCQTATDCNGDPCVAVGEVLVCQHTPPIWMHECPVQSPEENECCEDSECGDGNDGRCVATDLGYCGGQQPPQSNVCQYSSCSVHTDCSSGICLPAGVLNELSNTCLTTTCTRDSDCTASTDGQCALLYDGSTCPGLTMSCVYTGAECRRTEGCDNGLLCVADSNLPGGAACQENQPPPNASVR